jgi:hypothetical protein
MYWIEATLVGPMAMSIVTSDAVPLRSLVSVAL